MDASRISSRRSFLRLASAGVAGLAGAALLGCSGDSSPLAVTAPQDSTPEPGVTASPTPTPRPVPPAGRFERALLPGTPWETPLIGIHTGVRGSTVMFLGGVHGNEPGGWLAAEQLVEWQPTAGSLLIIPRANIVATHVLERTLPELGDLNRLYPGSLDHELPMARMAATIIEVAREFGSDLLIDMHESWGFYVERTQNGTAFIGQTVNSSTGPEFETIARTLIDRVNAGIDVERDRLVTRDQFPLPNATASATPPSNATLGRGSSSLSLGRHVPGLTSVLVEMGQDGQPMERRVALHLQVARAALELRGML